MDLFKSKLFGQSIAKTRTSTLRLMWSWLSLLRWPRAANLSWEPRFVIKHDSTWCPISRQVMPKNESWTPSPSLFKGGGRGWASPRSSHIAYTQGRTLSMADSHNFFAVPLILQIWNIWFRKQYFEPQVISFGDGISLLLLKKEISENFQDDGSSADKIKNDGIYSRYFTKLVAKLKFI